MGEKSLGITVKFSKKAPWQPEKNHWFAVSHAVQCPYCIDAYSSDAYEKGYSEAQMMEAVHVAAAIR
jgi:AhpD family alkylhydroperoxidase